MAQPAVFRHRLRILQRIVTKAFFRLMGPLNRSLQPEARFGIKSGYHHATQAEDFNAVGAGEEWQKEVYELAAERAHKAGMRSVIDIGCGTGFKLLKHFESLQTTGIEVEPTYTWLRDTYPARHWLRFGSFDPAKLEADLLICADVIEHLANPDDLMAFIGKIRFQTLVLSTPERNAVAGTSDFGPPENTCHFREWNAVEFRNYVSRFLDVEDQLIFPGKSTTQVVICRPKNPNT